MSDITSAWRALKARRLVAAFAIVSVGLGIGANTAIFSYLAEPFQLRAAGTGVSQARGRSRPALLCIQVVALLVLLIACANVGVSVALRRDCETSRDERADGACATRYRLIRVVGLEGLMIAATGGAPGAALAVWVGRF